MQRVSGFDEIQQAAQSYRPGQRAKLKLNLSGTVRGVIRDWARIRGLAAGRDLLISNLVDPESRPGAYTMIILLNGRAEDIAAFAADMKDACAR